MNGCSGSGFSMKYVSQIRPESSMSVIHMSAEMRAALISPSAGVSMSNPVLFRTTNSLSTNRPILEIKHL